MAKTDYTKLTDTAAGRAARQRKRREKLNDVADGLGFGSWGKMETAVINGDISLSVMGNYIPSKSTVTIDVLREIDTDIMRLMKNQNAEKSSERVLIYPIVQISEAIRKVRVMINPPFG